MALLGYTISTQDIGQDIRSSDPVPVGWYDAKITEADLKDTKAGTGRYIKLRMDVTGPTHQGRVVFTNINIQNQNPKAEEIGHQQLGQLMKAIGIDSLSDTDQLIGTDLGIKVAIRKSEEYGDQNEIKGYKSLTGSKPPATDVSAPSRATPPWKK